MREIAVFVEDFAHQQFLSTLIYRLAEEFEIVVKLEWRNTRRGHGAVARELKLFLRDLQLGRGSFPDLVVVATDANCKGFVERRNEMAGSFTTPSARIVYAIPDPHIERWLMLDSAAFKSVFGRGCDAPDLKCERARYKKKLVDSIRDSGVVPSLGGIEFAEDIVVAMDLDRACGVDPALARLVADLRSVFREWQISTTT
jgi:hypothetical protein